MVNSKNSLNLKPVRNNFQKNISSRKKVDGIIKKKNSDNFIVQSKKIDKIDKKEFSNSGKILKSNIYNKKNEIDNSSVDDTKRMFLKVAGVAGLGLAASALLPKSADAYVSGNTPTSNVVGIKNTSNEKINPAKEDGNLATLVTNTTPLANLQFDGNNNLLTKGTVAISNIANSKINPATEETLSNVGQSVNDQSVWMLRKILTLLKPLGITTGAGSNRLSVDINSGLKFKRNNKRGYNNCFRKNRLSWETDFYSLRTRR